MEQAKEELIKLGKTTGESYLPADINTKSPDAQLQNVIEGLSQASREYMLGQHSNELLPQAARQWINHTFASPYKVPHAIPMLRRSTSMKKAEAEGNLSPSFLEMLQESIGVNRHIHQERLLMSNSLPQRELILPLLKRPGELFDSLPGRARENLILNWQKLTGSKNPLPPQQTILSIESGIKKNPDILNWDYDPSQKRFVHSENWGKNSSSHLVSEKQLPQNLQSEEALNTIKSYSLLRRSLDNSPYTSPEGIRWGKKLFSASAKDRPGNLPSKWSVEESPQEYGLRYSSPDNPGHVVRLSGGNLYNAHKESRFPYVRHTCNGHYLNEKGEITTPFSPDSYIPLEKFNHSSIKKDPRLAVPPKLEQSLDIFTKKNELESLLKDKSGKGMTTCRDLIFHLKESSRHSNLDARQSELMNTILTEIQKLPEHPSVPEHSLDTAVKAARELMQTTGIQTIN